MLQHVREKNALEVPRQSAFGNGTMMPISTQQRSQRQRRIDQDWKISRCSGHLLLKNWRLLPAEARLKSGDSMSHGQHRHTSLRKPHITLQRYLRCSRSRSHRLDLLRRHRQNTALHHLRSLPLFLSRPLERWMLMRTMMIVAMRRRDPPSMKADAAVRMVQLAVELRSSSNHRSELQAKIR